MTIEQEKQELQIDSQTVLKCLGILQMALTKYSEKITIGNPMVKCEDMKHDVSFLIEAIYYMQNEK